MAEITKYPFVRHYRGEPTFHALRYRNGRLVREGRGLVFWFRPLTTGIAEIPLDDREVSFIATGRTADFQEGIAQGVVTYRVADPATVADRIDFTVDLDTGLWKETPLEQLSGLVKQLAQQPVLDYLARTGLRDALARGIDEIRRLIAAELAGDHKLAAMGIEIVAVRVTTVQATSEVEKALMTPALEAVQQQADEARFQRRALAVEKERAIAENELQNQIELARREEDLIAQRGANERREAEEEAARERIATEAQVARRRLDAEARADQIRELAAAEAERTEKVEGAAAEAEAKRIDVYRDLPVGVLMGLAARELATKLERIDHINLAPDLVTPILGDLLRAGAGYLNGGPANGGPTR